MRLGRVQHKHKYDRGEPKNKTTCTRHQTSPKTNETNKTKTLFVDSLMIDCFNNYQYFRFIIREISLDQVRYEKPSIETKDKQNLPPKSLQYGLHGGGKVALSATESKGLENAHVHHHCFLEHLGLRSLLNPSPLTFPGQIKGLKVSKTIWRHGNSKFQPCKTCRNYGFLKRFSF